MLAELHHEAPQERDPLGKIINRHPAVETVQELAEAMWTKQDYGWTTESGPHSCEYLVPAVLASLKGLGATAVLDLGAGNGALCRDLVGAGYRVVGVEPDAAGVNIARQACPAAHFYQLAVDDSPETILTEYPDGFDVVVSTEVIEHLYEPRNCARFAHAVLRGGGRLVITTPYHGYLKNLALALASAWDRHLNPLWDGGHIKFFSRKTLSQLLREEGFRVVSFRGVGRLPCLWKSMMVVAEKQ